MNNILIILLFSLSICFFNQNQAQVVSLESPQETQISNDLVKSLDLSYVYGGDYIKGKCFDEEELTQKVLSYPNLTELDISGQPLSIHLMSIIHDHLPSLQKLVIRGSVRFNDGDGLYYSWESLNQNEISAELLQTLLQNDSSIEILDLSLNPVNDEGLEAIAKGAFNLREIYLEGINTITDRGILILVESQPNLKLIDLSQFTVRQPLDRLKTISSEVSQDVINDLSNRGIIIVQNHRIPWF